MFENGVNAWQRVVEAKYSSGGMSAYEALHFGLHVIIGLAISAGCGLLGGPVFPMLVVGACVGVSLPSRLVPLNLTLPCCMAASVGAFVPAPFTVISTISLVFRLDTNQSISVFIATMAACTCTGGTGGLRCMFEYVWGVPRLHNAGVGTASPRIGHEPDSTTVNDDEADSERPPSDFEILNGVRSAIFGSPASS
jgi:Voltage gated chloride channel